MQITASQVKELRERTGAGMMECKKALTEAGGDMEAAIEAMRKSGAAKAVKKAGRLAAEGQVVIAMSDDGGTAVLVEINCETDFVGKDENFEKFADAVAQCALRDAPADVAALMALDAAGKPLETAREELVTKVGENVQVRRFERVQMQGDCLGSYRHGVRIGVLVDLAGGDEELARDLSMHIAASRPVCIDEAQVAPELIDKEREIFSAQALESGKPPQIVEKMVEGRIKKFLGEITLLGQPFVKQPDMTVAQLLKEKGASVKRFVRFEVGEGIEKKTENFAEEVMAQVKAS
ncbi:translation elongation factor Ts [Acidihalobacter ferrooxydans]|uniref:Elongation factor Ts n=1 Tax=Acidihalobacter ferrooxydans TaxID=1765967 RepID=A0A1P8UHD8_9GAMM|nr:translation elongation factor Ts [Acidihalobacter ferrooxydans]APZ43237.1 translation elongation factor Ts [Acidihalobacter ferrooxydans]